MMTRKPVVAGKFYPGMQGKLRSEIEGMVTKGETRERAIGLISPHAGYPFSGPVAGATLSRVEFTDTFVIIGPNHSGMGAPFAIMTSGSWETPLGNVEIDSEMGAMILEKSGYLEEDPGAHAYEHSIEVQLPFLQYFNEAVKIVPIILGPASGTVYKRIGIGIADALRQLGERALIVASSDMTHYESQESAKTKDTMAIESILELDEDKLLNQVERYNITMCGYGPAVALIAAAKSLGAREAELVEYRTSGDATGDYSSVVGYAGIIIK